MSTISKKTEQLARQHLASLGIVCLSYESAAGNSRGPKVSFACSCGQVITKHFSELKKQGPICSVCMKERFRASRSIPQQTVEAFLATEGASLIRLYIGPVPGHRDQSRVLYRCKCGTEVDRPWGTLSNPALRTKPKCRECSLKEKELPCGPDCHNWNPDMVGRERERKWGQQDRVWASQVFERDNYTCQITGKRGCQLSAHHILSKIKNPESRYLVSNGITLSRDVHKKFHTGSRVHEFDMESLVRFALTEYGVDLTHHTAIQLRPAK